VEGGILLQAGFIMFEDNASASGFKFNKGDTIFLSIQSQNRPGAEKLFGFADSVNTSTWKPVAVAAGEKENNRHNRNNDNVGFVMTSVAQSTMRFHFITDSTDATDPFNPTSIGIPVPLTYAPTTVNTGRVNLQSVSEKWLGIVIDSTNEVKNSAFAQLSLNDLYLAPTGKWLAGKIEVQDTLLVSYGRNDNPVWVEQTVTAPPRVSGEDTRNRPPNGPMGVQKPYWTFETHSLGALIAVAEPLSTLGYGPVQDDGSGGSWTIDKDSAWYIMADTTGAGGVLVPFSSATGGGTMVGFNKQADGTIVCLDQADYSKLYYVSTSKDSTPNNWQMNTGGVGGRAPVSVRRGSSYWTYSPDSAGSMDYQLYNNYDQVETNNQHIAGAPVLFLTLLPGDPAFVRWNVGFGGYTGGTKGAPNTVNFITEGRLRNDGRLVPTVRRPNVSGQYIADETVSIGGGGINTSSIFRGAHTIVDTITRYYDVASSTWKWQPDTLFIFDADSNLSLDSTMAAVIGAGDASRHTVNSGTGAPIAMSTCWNVFGVRKYDTIYQPGRRVYNWGYDYANDNDPDRVRKIRLFAFLPTTDGRLVGHADTLNSAFASVLDGLVPAFSSKGVERGGSDDGGSDGASVTNAIWVTAGPISKMVVEFQKAGSGNWESFPGKLTSSEAKTAGHKIRAILTDRCSNVVGEGMVAIKAYGTDTRLDTVALTTTDKNNANAGLHVLGTDDPAIYTVPTEDTLYLWSRSVAGSDDRGQVQATFSTTCRNEAIYFSFAAFIDSATNPGSQPLLRIGGNLDDSYKIEISGSTTIASLMMSNSKNDFIRSAGGGWPTPDTASVAAASSCSDDEVIFKVQSIDDCGHILEFDEAALAQLTFEQPVWVKGGWGSLASWKRKIPVQSDPMDPASDFVYSANANTAAYSSSGVNFWGSVLDEASGYGSTPNATINTLINARHDTVGSYDGNPWISDDKKSVYIKYKPGNTSQDTVRIKIKSKTFEDETIIATLSTEPGNFRLYTRNIGDTALVASRGDVQDTTKTTYAYGVLRDCNNELVSSDYGQYTYVYWRLVGTSRWSAFLFDPALAYDLSQNEPTMLPTFTVQKLDSIKAYRGTRQLRLSRLSNGKAYIGINSDTVGGTNTVVGRHVFPVERNTVFPSGTYNSADSLRQLYAWNGTEAWNQPRGLSEGSTSDAEVATSDIVGITNADGTTTLDIATYNRVDSVFTGIWGSNKSFEGRGLQNNYRGYNALEAVAYFYKEGGVVRKLTTTRDNTIGTNKWAGVARYRVNADKVNQIAFVDGVGDFYDIEESSTENQLAGLNFLNLYGRQAARIKKLVTLPEITTERRVIDEENVVVPNPENSYTVAVGLGKNSWKGGRSYAGRVVPLYLRAYDMYGNPVMPLRSQVSITKGSNSNITDRDNLRIPVGPDQPFGSRTDTNFIYNQYFVGNFIPSNIVNWTTTSGSKETAGVGIEATSKDSIIVGKLRGAIKIQYQTLSHSGSSNGSATDTTLPNTNVADDQPIIAKYVVGDGTTLKDVAYVASKKTGNLASYKIGNGSVLTGGRVGIGNVVNWIAYDNIGEEDTKYGEPTYPIEAQLLWYDYRYTSIPKVLVAADNQTGAPLIDLYPRIKTDPPTENLGGYAEIAALLSNNYSSGWGTGSTYNDRTYLSVKTHEKPTEFGDFKAKEYSNPFRNTNNVWDGYLGGPYATNALNNFGFRGGVGRIKLVSRKADTVNFTIIDSVSYNLSLTNSSIEPIVGEPTKNLTVLPGLIHWVAMANADAVDLDKEAVYPRPLRANYDGVISLINGTDPDNRSYDDTSSVKNNPRSYAVPVDTVFIGQVYNIEVRNYDRFGNRNTIDSIYVSLEHSGTGYWTDNWGSSNEFLLIDNERANKKIDDVRNDFHTIPNADNNLLPGIVSGKGFDHQITMSFRKKGTGFTANGNVYLEPDLVNQTPNGVNIQPVAWRKLWVMKLEKPGGFDILSSNSSHNLVRLDDGYTLSWTAAKSTNTFDDGIEYNVKFYDGSSYSTITDQSVPVGVINIPYKELARDSGGVSTIQTKTLKSEALSEAIGLGYRHYNRNVKLVLEAKNKWGHTTNASSILDLDFELNKKPEAFTFNTIPSDLNVVSAPFTFTWTVPVDSNGTTGLNAQAITSYSKSFNLDSLEYQVVFVPIEVVNGKADTARFNVGLPYGGNSAAITKEFLTKALDSADAAKYQVYVVVKDRTTKSWDDPNFTTHSNVQTVSITKAGNFAKVLIDDVNKAGQPDIEIPVATDHKFTLTVADADGNAIRGFSSESPIVKLKLLAVETGNYPSAYGGNKILKLSVDSIALVGDGTNGFELPSNLFVDGKVTITYNNTKSGIIHINVPNNNPVFKAIGEGEDEENNLLAIVGTDTRNFITVAGAMDRLTVEVTPRSGTDIVYVERPMQVLVAPADIYGNAIESVSQDQAMLVTLSPRYPENFVTGDFATVRSITGRTHYVLIPKVVQNDNWMQAFSYPDYKISSNIASFKVLAHPPSAFTLVNPANNNELQLQNHSQRIQFSWTKSTDPNNTSLVDLSGKNWNDADVVKYTVKVREQLNYVFPDSIDTDETLWATGTTLYNLALLLGGGEADKGCPISWYVIASDGLYETSSDIRTAIIRPMGIVPVTPVEAVPVAFALGQNYPNPFNPTTNIQYDIPKASDVKIVIYNILGQPVRTLVNERKEAAKYNVVWDGKNDQGISVATGIYIYQIHAGEFSATKKMNLLK